MAMTEMVQAPPIPEDPNACPYQPGHGKNVTKKVIFKISITEKLIIRLFSVQDYLSRLSNCPLLHFSIQLQLF